MVSGCKKGWRISRAEGPLTGSSSSGKQTWVPVVLALVALHHGLDEVRDEGCRSAQAVVR